MITEGSVVIDAGSIGYEVKISASTANSLPRVGQEVRLYTYTHIREDAFVLYGFLSQDEKELFQKLISVNGVGPKGGQAILSVMSVDDLCFAIVSADAKAITKAPGIGARTAERIILDLRDKVEIDKGLAETMQTPVGDLGVAVMGSSAKNEAVAALVALGYGATEAMRAVKSVDSDEGMETEAILKAALRVLY